MRSFRQGRKRHNHFQNVKGKFDQERQQHWVLTYYKNANEGFKQ